MSRERMYYSRTGHFSNEENIDDVEVTKTNLDENFFRIAKSVDKAEIYVSTSQSYIRASKRTIEDLKKCLINAEANMGTAEECTLELEKRLKNLKSEIHFLFNRSFYTNTDHSLNEISRAKPSFCAMSHNNSSLIEDLPSALEKYAEESNVNLKNHNVSVEKHDGLIFVVLNPKNAVDKCSTNQINRTSTDSSVQEETLNSTLDNNLQEKEDEISFPEIDCQSGCSQAEDATLNNDMGYKDSFSGTFVKDIRMQSSVKKDECDLSLAKEVTDGCNEAKFQSDCSSYHKSSAMDHLQKASDCGQMSVVSASGSRALQNYECVQTESSGKNKKCKKNSLNMVNKGIRRKSQNGCSSLDTCSINHLKMELPNQRKSEDPSSRAFQDDKLGDQQDKNACKKKDAKMTTHSNGTRECGWETSMNRKEAKRKQNKHWQSSENHKVQIENFDKMSPSSSSEETSKLNKIADANPDAKSEAELIRILPKRIIPRISPCRESYHSAAKNVSPFLSTLSEQGGKSTLPKSSSENNLSRLTGCRSKSVGIKTVKPCRKDETGLADEILGWKLPEYRFLSNRTTPEKTSLPLQNHSYMRNASTRHTKESISSKESKRRIHKTFEDFENQINLGNKHLSNLKKFFTPQFENRRLTTRRKEDFLEKNFNPLVRGFSLKDLPSSTNLDFLEEPREITTTNSIFSTCSSFPLVGKNVDNTLISENQVMHGNRSFSAKSSKIPSPEPFFQLPEDVYFPVYKNNIIESSDTESSNLIGDSPEWRVCKADSPDLSNEDDLSDEADLSGSIHVHVSDASIHNRSESSSNEVFHGYFKDMTGMPQYEHMLDDKTMDSMESFVTANESRSKILRESFNGRSFSQSSSGESDSTKRALPSISIYSCHTRNGTPPLASSANISTFRSKTYSCSSPTPDYSP